VRNLQLRNSETYSIFFADLLYDPRLGHNDDYLFRLVGDVFKANGYNAFAIVDSLDNRVRIGCGDRWYGRGAGGFIAVSCIDGRVLHHVSVAL
jgi:hypothetical protein